MNADVVIVGARCAGAPLATWLARGGARVLLLDAAALPRDQTSSTHLIQPYGIALLDELGVGDAVRAITSPIRRLTTRLEGHDATVEFEARHCISPRRKDLDGILLDEARRAGAEVMLQARVTGLLRRGDRVAGVRVEQRGRELELRAPWVVGADGRRSTVARHVEAPEYEGFDGQRAVYWAYWPRPASYDRDELTRETALMVHEGRVICVCTPTNTDQLLLGVSLPRSELKAWRGDVRRGFLDALRAHSFARELIGGAPGTIYGTRAERYFFRRPVGPGWALVGDAGLHKDPHAGLGISDALRDARALARAIAAGEEAALERYWRERDLASTELFHFARDLGEPSYNNLLNRSVMARVGRSTDLRARLRAAMDRDVSPYAALPASAVLSAVGGQVLRGRVQILGELVRAAKRMREVQTARRRCERALREVA